MKVCRLIISSVANTVLSSIVGAVTCGGVFNWVYKLEPTNVWKPMEGAPGISFMVGIFVINLIFAFVYALLKKGLPGEKNLVKGLIFGLCVWSVGILPGMFFTYYFMTVAATVLVYWLVSDLIMLPVKGIIVAVIYGE